MSIQKGRLNVPDGGEYKVIYPETSSDQVVDVESNKKVSEVLIDFSEQLAQIEINVKSLGAIGDGNSHPLSDFFPTLALAQVKYPHATDLTNEVDWAAIQLAVNSPETGNRIFIPNGTYLIPLPITNLRSNIEISGSKNTVILNMLDKTVYPRGTLQGLFQGNFSPSGNYLGEASIGNLVNANGYEITLDGTANVVKDDIVRFDSHIAIVESVNGSVITCDRAVVDVPTAGTTVYKLTNPLKNIYIHDLMFDFNGTVESPRYGYGVLLNAAYDCKIERIRAKNIGSKVIQINHSLDCFIDDVYCDAGTDNYGTGGHSYVIRVSQCDNIKMSEIGGRRTRHVVDISNAHRNTSQDCYGELNVTDFLTHFNSCKYNSFINCNAKNSETAAYSFTPSSGDKYNYIIGGIVDGAFMPSNTILDETIVIENVIFKNARSTLLGLAFFNSCKFYFGKEQTASFLRNISGELNVFFDNCFFNSAIDSIANPLLNSTNTADVSVDFSNCQFIVSNNLILVNGNENTSIKLNDCKFTVTTNQISNTPYFSTDNIIEVKGGSYQFVSSGYSFFGLGRLQIGGKLTLDGVNIINSSQVWRRFKDNAITVAIGNNNLINSSYTGFNSTNMETIGVANPENLPSIPANGNWKKGARLINKDIIAGGYAEYICVISGTPGTWKGAGLIQA